MSDPVMRFTEAALDKLWPTPGRMPFDRIVTTVERAGESDFILSVAYWWQGKPMASMSYRQSLAITSIMTINMSDIDGTAAVHVE